MSKLAKLRGSRRKRPGFAIGGYDLQPFVDTGATSPVRDPSYGMSNMDDSNPLIAIVVSCGFVVVGLVAIALPKQLQEMAIGTYDKKAWARHMPFLAFANSSHYVPAMRVMGWMFLCVGSSVLMLSIYAWLRQ
jgi:hypothetical protein